MRREYFVASRDVRLHVVDRGEPGRPAIMLAHGFPDCHRVYEPLMDDLARDHHVVTFDMRGVGRSTAPRSRRGYRIEALMPDFDAVADAAFGRRAPFHLVGHDWGSVLGFSYVASPVRSVRLRSYTSVSGPHVSLMWKAALDALVSGSDRRGALEQLSSSWYVFALHLPLLPKALARFRGPKMIARALSEGGVPADDPYLDVSPSEAYGRIENAIELYRQNALRPPPAPRPGSMETPLQLLIAKEDPFVRPVALSNLEHYATNVERHYLDVSHWLPRSHPTLMASRVRDFVARHDAQSASGASTPGPASPADKDMLR